MSLRVHHLSCGTLCPLSRRLINGEGGWLEPAHMVCHVLLLESPAGLVLVDTGFGEADMAADTRLPAPFRAQAGLRRRPQDTARAQIVALGLDPGDVRHILLTHLDLDHAGGLSDFPEATVHLHLREQQAASTRRSFLERQRYLPAQLAHGPRWQTHAPEGEAFHGFAAARAIPELGEDILLLPLHGHTHGHSGIAVRGEAGWLLHCGDAYFHHATLAAQGQPPAGLRGYERLIAMDNAQRLHNQQRLRELAANRPELRLFCSHDPQEYAGLARAAAG